MVQRGEHFLEVHWSRIRGFCVTGRRADGLTVSHPTACEKSAGNSRPMVSTGCLVDSWRAAELTPNDDRDIVQHVMGFEVADQRGQSVVHRGKVFPQRDEVVAVSVPAAPRTVHRDDSHTHLDQATSDKQILIRAAVSIDDLGILFLHVERICNLAGCDDVNGGLGETVQRLHLAACVSVSAKSVEGTQQFRATLKAIFSQRSFKPETVRGARIEWLVGRSHIARRTTVV